MCFVSLAAQTPGGRLYDTDITTLPFIFGARGTVLFSEAEFSLLSLGFTIKQADNILAAGVRAVI